MIAQTIQIPATDGGEFNAYLVSPATRTGAVVIVIQEICGINTFMRQKAAEYAAAGYFAIVPDLFWRLEPRIELDPTIPEELNRAFEFYTRFDQNLAVEDLIATLKLIQQYPGCTGQVGTVGFCLGGKLAYLMATRSTALCNVGYYGVGIEQNLSEATQITQPLMLHIAEQDQYVSIAVQQQIQATLENHSLVQLHFYPVGHAFASPTDPRYAPEAAALANRRTLEFLEQYLNFALD